MSLDEKLSLLEHRVDALAKVAQNIYQQNELLKQKEIELIKKNDLAKSKVEEMIRKLKHLDK